MIRKEREKDTKRLAWSTDKTFDHEPTAIRRPVIVIHADGVRAIIVVAIFTIQRVIPPQRRGEPRGGRSRRRASVTSRHVTIHPSAGTRDSATSWRIVRVVRIVLDPRFPVSARSRVATATLPRRDATSRLLRTRDIAADETSRDRIDAPS